MWIVTECHQILALEKEQDRLVLEPLKERNISITLNSSYASIFQIPESSNFQFYSVLYHAYRYEMNKYLRDNLEVITANGNVNRVGRFFRFSFRIENTNYRISEFQYIQWEKKRELVADQLPYPNKLFILQFQFHQEILRLFFYLNLLYKHLIHKNNQQDNLVLHQTQFQLNSNPLLLLL